MRAGSNPVASAKIVYNKYMADETSKTLWDSVRTSKFFKFFKKLLKIIFITWPIGVGFTIWHLAKPDQYDHYITEHVHPDRRKAKK